MSKKRTKKVVVVGDAGVDIIVPFPTILKSEKTKVSYKNPVLIGGGTAANTAVSLSRLGIETSFIGTVGDDQYGKYVMADLKKENINIEHLIVDHNLNTVGVFAFIDEQGERYLWGWPRQNQSFKEIDLKKVDFNLIKDADWVHSSGMALIDNSSSRDAIIEIFKFAFNKGINTSLDLNLRVKDGTIDKSYRDAVIEIIGYCTYVLGSGEDEFYHLSNQDNWLDSAKSFSNKERTIIARMGKEGSMALTENETIIQKAYHVSVVDTVGAGDVHNGGFITARLNGLGLKESLNFANAVSAFTVSKEGARSSPALKELEHFIKTHNYY